MPLGYRGLWRGWCRLELCAERPWCLRGNGVGNPYLDLIRVPICFVWC